MKIRIAGALALAVSMAVSAKAETKDATTINPEALARVDGITAYCSRVDAPHASLYHQRQAAFIRGHAESEIKGDRALPRYEYELNTVNAQLGKIAGNAAPKTCSALVAGL